MGNGDQGADEYGSGGASTGNDVQGGGPYGDTLQDRELGSDRGDAEGAEGVPPSIGPKDSRDVKLASRVVGMGVVIGG